jgi:hypothetical protein
MEFRTPFELQSNFLDPVTLTVMCFHRVAPRRAWWARYSNLRLDNKVRRLLSIAVARSVLLKLTGVFVYRTQLWYLRIRSTCISGSKAALIYSDARGVTLVILRR